MTKKDFFRVVIKLFGLFGLIYALFVASPRALASLSFLFFYSDFASAIFIITALVIVFFVFWFIIRRTDKLIEWLRLDSGFDDDRLEFQNFSTENIVKIAAILFGGFVLLLNIPEFISQAFLAFKDAVQPKMTEYDMRGMVRVDLTKWVNSFLNIIIGYLILTNYGFISRKLTKAPATEATEPEA